MKSIAFAVLACCAFGAQAAPNAGTLENVVGTVSVGGQGFVAQAKSGMALAEGSTVLVSSKGMATVALANGCTVSLMGSQHFTVNSKLSCEQSIASVKSLAATTRLAQAPVGTGTGGTTGGAGAGFGAGGFGAGAFGFAAFGVGAIAANNSVNNNASGS